MTEREKILTMLEGFDYSVKHLWENNYLAVRRGR